MPLYINVICASLVKAKSALVHLLNQELKTSQKVLEEPLHSQVVDKVLPVLNTGVSMFIQPCARPSNAFGFSF